MEQACHPDAAPAHRVRQFSPRNALHATACKESWVTMRQHQSLRGDVARYQLDSHCTLDSDQVYALTAYILHINGLVSEDASMNAKTLPAIVMPNRNGFFRTPNQPGR
jgi:hypothetical protein